MTKWYYISDSLVKGPIKGPEFKELITSGIIKTHTPVWTDGMEEWLTANEIGVFNSKFKGNLSSKEAVFSLLMSMTLLGCIILGILLDSLLSTRYFLPRLLLGVMGIISIPLSIWLGRDAIKKIKIGKAKGMPYAILGIISGMLVVVTLITAGMYLPRFSCSHEKAFRLFCTNNLKQISLALEYYANDNEGYYPPYYGAMGLELLRKNDYLNEPKFFICPNQIVTPTVPLNEKNICYYYIGGLMNTKEDAKKPIIWDFEDNHEKYGNLILADRTLEFFIKDKWIEKQFELLKRKSK